MSIFKRALRRAGYEIRPIEPPFMPHIRRYEFTGTPFDFWIANADAVWWYDESEWTKPGEFSELRRLMSAGDRVLEIGSHHGFTGVLCSTLVGADGFVLGLEAHPGNALVATGQVGLNPSIRNLKFINAAGSDRESTVRISPDHNSQVAPGGRTSVEVPARTGDDLDREYGPFTVLKIDVEGFEGAVLRGCKQILQRRPKVAIEVHIDALVQFGSDVAEIFALLGLEEYEGSMVIRPDYHTVRPFDPSQLPGTGIVNLFLSPR